MKYSLDGPYLILTKKEKLAHWSYLISKWSKMEALIYQDKEGPAGLEALRKWCIYRTDVTERGRLTERNKVLKFKVLVTTVDRVMDTEDFLLRDLPFIQVILDNAEEESH